MHAWIFLFYILLFGFGICFVSVKIIIAFQQFAWHVVRVLNFQNQMRQLRWPATVTIVVGKFCVGSSSVPFRSVRYHFIL